MEGFSLAGPEKIFSITFARFLTNFSFFPPITMGTFLVKFPITRDLRCPLVNVEVSCENLSPPRNRCSSETKLNEKIVFKQPSAEWH